MVNISLMPLWIDIGKEWGVHLLVVKLWNKDYTGSLFGVFKDEGELGFELFYKRYYL